VFLLATLAAPAAMAATPMLEASLAASVFNLGVAARVAPGMKFSLWNQPDNILFSDTFLKTEVGVDLTLVYARVVPKVTFSPIAVLEMSAHYGGSVYFGTFNGIVPFATPDAPNNEALFDTLHPEPGQSHRVGGQRHAPGPGRAGHRRGVERSGALVDHALRGSGRLLLLRARAGAAFRVGGDLRVGQRRAALRGRVRS
jgi:hypothetical protein